MNRKEKKVLMPANTPESLAKRIRRYCEVLGQTYSEITRDMWTKRLDREDKKKAKK